MTPRITYSKCQIFTNAGGMTCPLCGGDIEPNKIHSCRRADTCEREGCTRDAAVMVGANGQWHLCSECAQRPEFRRFRVRTPLRTEATNA